MLDDTDLSVWDRTYVEGKRGAGGTAVLLYDPSNATATTIINRILTNNAAADALALVLNTKTNKNIAYNVRINSAAVVMATREAVAVTIGFTATGPATGTIAGA
jgi:predicted MarR family transcription regulator